MGNLKKQLENRTGTQPAAGAEFLSVAFTTDKIIRYFRLTLTTDANATNRRVYLSVLRTAAPTSIGIVWVAAVNQVASTGQTYFIAELPADRAGTGSKVETMGKCFVPVGCKIAISIDNLQAGDQLSDILWTEQPI